MLELRKRGHGRRAIEPAHTAREHRLATYLPYLSMVGDDVMMLTNGDVMASFILRGIEAQTAEQSLLEDVAQAMAASVAQAKPNIAFYVHRVSHEVSPELTPIDGSGFAAQVDAAWQGALQQGGLRDRVSMVTVVIRPQRLGGLWSKISGGSKRDLRAERARRIATLNETIETLMQALWITQPERMTKQDGRWLGLLRATLGGSYAPLTVGQMFEPPADLMVDSRVDFRGDTFLRYGLDVEDMRYGAMFCLKKYPTQTWPGCIDRLDLPADTVVTHSFVPMELVAALARVQRTGRQLSAADDAARSAHADLVSAADDLASGRISFGEHQLTIMVSARTESDLNDMAADIRTQVQRVGGVAVREDIGARAAFFAQHPGNFGYRARASMISSACFADFASLHTSGRGLEPGTEPWGEAITVLPTAGAEPYRLNFHQAGDPGERAPGHTLVIGRTGSGKTLGMAFLLSQAQRLSPRIIAFDKDRGMESALRALGGSYAPVRMGEATGFNPFRAEVDARGVGWLTDWLAAILTIDGPPLSPTQSEALSQAVQSNANADPGLQTLFHFRSQLQSVDDEGDLYTRLGQWDRGGQYHWLFSGEGSDPLAFDNDVTGFDLSEIFDTRAVRTAWLSYVFRRIERTVEDGRPTIIVMDEAWKLLDDAYFEARLKDWMLTMRKKNVVVVMLTQRVSHIAESRAGGSILESVATQILFPNRKNNARELEPLGVTDREEGFLCSSSVGGRMALVRSSDTSTIVDFDLRTLGPLLGVLGGGSMQSDDNDSDIELDDDDPMQEAL